MWKKLAGGLLSLGLILLVTPFLYVLYLGGIKQVVTDELNNLSPAISVDVGAARFAFSVSALPVTIIADDVTIKNGDDTLIVPNARIGFGLHSILHGRPDEARLRGLQLDLVRDDEGWAASPTTSLLNELVDRDRATADSRNNGKAAPVLGGIKNLILQSDHLTITHKGKPNIAPLKMIDVSVQIAADEEHGIGGTLRMAREIDGQGAGGITARFTGWPATGDFLAELAFSEFQPVDMPLFFDAVPAGFGRLGVVLGTVTAGIAGMETRGADNGAIAFGGTNLKRLEADLTARGGTLSVPGSGKNAGFDVANVALSYQRDANILSIRQAEIALNDRRQISFVGDVIDFHAARPAFNGVLTASRLSLASLYNDWPTGIATGVRSALEQRFTGGGFSDLSIKLVGGFDRDTQHLVISQLDFAADFDAVRMNVSGGQYRRLVGTIDGNMALKLGAGGQVENVSFGLNLQNGSVVLADYPTAVPLDRLAISANLRDGQLSVEEMAIAFGDGGAVTADGTLALQPDWSPERLDFSLQTKLMDIALYHAIWPSWAVAKTRGWVKDKITDGNVQDANLTLTTIFGNDGPKLTKLTGALGLNDARIALGGKIPILDKVSARISVDEQQAEIKLLSGAIDQLALQQGRVTIAPILGNDGPQAEAELTLKGEVGSALTIAQSFGLASVGVFDLASIEAAGEVEMAIQSAFPLAGELDGDNIDISVDATVAGGQFRNLPFDADVDRAELVLSLRPGIVELTGSADLFSVPASFSFVSNLANDTVEFVGKAPPSAAMAERLAGFSQIEIAGDVGATITLQSDTDFADMKVALVTEMRRASINVPVINWAKLPGENGVASLTFGVRDGRIYSLDEIDIALGSLTAVGRVVLGENNAVRGAFFERVVWPGNDLRDVIMETGSEGEWKIGANARLIDLVPLRRNRGVGEGRPMSFDIVAERIVIGQDIVLQGHIVGNKRADGGGLATFSGNLIRRNKAMITEAEMDLSYGQKGDLLNGTGLIGGAETTIAYTDSATDDPTLTMVSRNAGRMLNGLEITDAISSGEIVLTNRFIGDNLDEFDTDIKLSGFNVLEAPRALRMFSVLGPVGLYKLVEGEGTYFAWGEAQLEKRGPIVRLQKVRAGGDAVAVSLVGTYDTKLRQVDVSGNLVPANFVNKIAEVIPLLGKVLTGTDNSGILVSQFSMTGDIDDPVTTTNAASLVPGVLRDILSPDWLEREGERLLGADNATTQPSKP